MSPITIFVVDDEPMVLKYVSFVLRDAGYNVLEAGKSSIALTISERYEGAIDLLICDVTPLYRSRINLADHLLQQRPAMQVLFMSGSPSDDELLARTAGGMARMLLKPFGPAVLLTRVWEALGDSNSGS
jgi:CheY-like chemotaxis protein